MSRRTDVLGSLVALGLLIACAGEAGAPDASAHGGADAMAGSDGGARDAGAPNAVDAGSTDAGSTDSGSTDAGSTDAGSTDAGPPLEGPCPAYPAPCLVLPMGDSVTFGMRATPSGATSSGGYRRYLRRRLLDEGRAFAYVGACPGVAGRCRIPPDGDPLYCAAGGAPEIGRHDGHPGWDVNAFRARTGGACPGSIATFLARVTDDAGDHVTPHVVLLMVGANDVRAGAGIRDGAATRFGYLMDELLAALPDTTLLVVGTVTPNLNGTNDRDGVRPFNRVVRTIVGAHRDAGRNVMLVDTYGAIRVDGSGSSPDVSSDGLHPNEQGYQRIADVWYDAIGDRIRDH